jgi:hypothetical protein
MEQIRQKKYADKYSSSNKIITGIAFNFNSTKRCIDDWQEERL